MVSLFMPLLMEAGEDATGELAILLPIIISLGLFLMIFGLNYLKSRERMALIERGIELKDPALRDRTSSVLRTSLLFIGVGIGLIIAYFISANTEANGEAIYFPLLFIFGGLGLLVSYIIERKREKIIR